MKYEASLACGKSQTGSERRAKEDVCRGMAVLGQGRDPSTPRADSLRISARSVQDDLLEFGTDRTIFSRSILGDLRTARFCRLLFSPRLFSDPTTRRSDLHLYENPFLPRSLF